jgi:SAM-dependent methyltransferase
MPRRVAKSRRRSVFGRDPRAYDRARLPYPKRLYSILERRCGLGAGTAVLEIGPGTGIATRELLGRGASPMTLVEVDPRLARYLRATVARSASRVRIVRAPFEAAKLPTSGFDLVVAASSFHWLPQRRALRKVARVLHPGGWWAAWNNHHGDPSRRSEFHDELQPLYQKLSGRRRPSYGASQRLRAQDRREAERRLAALRAVGTFDRITKTNLRWTVPLTADGVVRLWSTFSDVATLPPARRRWFLGAIDQLVKGRFGGKVTLPVVTPLYTARRF